MIADLPRLPVRFFSTLDGGEPVREWLRSLPKADRKVIGETIRFFQFRWPVGMPLVRKLEADLWELRIRMPERNARLFFTIEDGAAILLHGFMKKSQNTPRSDLALARSRKRILTGRDKLQ